MATARPLDWKAPDYTEVFRERTRRMERVRAAGDEGWERLLKYYADGNYLDFVEDWCFTYDPRNLNKKRAAYVPFLMFPKQREAFAWIHDRLDRSQDGLLEKSRDMGASWIALSFALSMWLFMPAAKIGVGSRKEDLVDKMGDPDSLLEKIRMMLRMLPPELMPPGFSIDKHAKFMNIVNPSNGAVIAGEAGKNIGRGGRSTLYILDEAAFVEQPDKVEAALSGNTQCRIDVSTPNGKGNPFYKKRMGGKVRTFTLHWRDDPRKDDDWYDEQVERLDPKILAQEVDLDYDASGEESTISSEWVRSSQALRRYLEKTGEMPNPDQYPGVGGLDVGGGRSNSVFVARHGPVVSPSHHWKDPDSINTAVRARELAEEEGVQKVNYDEIGVGKGVTSAFRRMRKPRVNAINVGNSPTSRRWADGRTAKQKFKNLRAEIWWMARDRLRKAHLMWLHIQGKSERGGKVTLDEVLLLPDDQKLCGELSIPSWGANDAGKIKIQSKDQLDESPDFADALMLTFAPKPSRVRGGKTTGL